MKIAHALLVHKQPDQVARLIKALAHPDSHCWIHMDKKFDNSHFRNALSKENAFLIQPGISVNWGCYNTVEAMLLVMEAIVNADEKYDYLNFMSGQDYPIQPPLFFRDYLKECDSCEFIGNRPLEESIQNITRFKKYHFNSYRFPGKKLFERLVNKILPQRQFPYPYTIRKGPQWMTLTRSAALYILDFVKHNPRYVNYFKTVHIPDEFFFQTILFNSPFKHKMRNQIFHHIDWSELKKNPKILTMEDYTTLTRSNLFFARKFDATIDSAILDALDKSICEKQLQPQTQGLF